MPRRLIRVASRALPVWVGFRGRGLAKRVALGKSAGFGVAAFLFLDFGEKQAQAALLHTTLLRDFDLVSGFARQSGIKGNPRQKQPTFGMGRISRNQALGSAGAR
jgi:hypothetical protein